MCEQSVYFTDEGGGIMEMSIIDLSVGLSQAQMASSISTAVLAKSIDMMETAGAGMIDMMERSVMEHSVNPGVGSNIDITL